tara:strand:- start:757 stop:1158 length:402 start_codon:yes stop_codon:yes gene_type:complete
MSRKAKGPGFTQRSGKSPAFKMIGSSPPEGVYTDPNDPGVNRTWVNDRGTTMYRHPDGNSSSIAYDPAKVGVAVRGDSRGYFDYKGQAATSGIEELKNRQNRSSTARQAFFGGNKPDSSPNIDKDDFWSQYSF